MVRRKDHKVSDFSINALIKNILKFSSFCFTLKNSSAENTELYCETEDHIGIPHASYRPELPSLAKST